MLSFLHAGIAPKFSQSFIFNSETLVSPTITALQAELAAGPWSSAIKLELEAFLAGALIEARDKKNRDKATTISFFDLGLSGLYLLMPLVIFTHVVQNTILLMSICISVSLFVCSGSLRGTNTLVQALYKSKKISHV